MDDYADLKQAIITTVYRFDRPSLDVIVKFIRENRAAFRLSERDIVEKTIRYAALILQRDQFIQRHSGRSGDFYVIDASHATEASRISAGYNIREVHIDEVIENMSAGALSAQFDISQSVIYDVAARVPRVATPADTASTPPVIPEDTVAAPSGGCVIV